MFVIVDFVNKKACFSVSVLKKNYTDKYLHIIMNQTHLFIEHMSIGFIQTMVDLS